MGDGTGKKILLIGWDGADWRLIRPLLEAGEMPNLARLVEGGVMGNLASLQPTLSPMIWTSIATGKLPDKHGIHGFTETQPGSGRVLPTTCLSRTAKALWNILSQRQLRSLVVNWFTSHPAEPIDGVCLSALYPFLSLVPPGRQLPIPPGTVHPPELREQLPRWVVRPDEIDAATIKLFVPRFREVDQDNDRRLATIASMLARCFSVHAAFTALLEEQRWDFAAVYYGEIDHFCHGFLQFHPPRMPTVSQVEFELYRDVVDGIYRLHDLLLGRLLALAGDETAVLLCSDHGFLSGELRPQRMAPVPVAAAAQHRSVGILAMAGPGIRRDELVHGASVLDIAPTVLSVLGLPVGRDMDGRPLLEAFETVPPLPAPVPSWEEIDGPAGLHPPGTRIDLTSGDALHRQFAALGYVEPPDAEGGGNAATEIENQWNLARSLMQAGGFLKALPLLEDIYAARPLRSDFGLTLAECQFRLGLGDEAYRLICNLAAAYPGQPRARLLLGVAEYYRGHTRAALEHLEALSQAQLRMPVLFLQLGNIYLHLCRPGPAMEAFQRVLDLDPEFAAAHLGLARCYLRNHDYAAAAAAALDAVGLEFSLAAGHYCLGRALVELGRNARAVEAFEACLRFQPRHAGAHGCLARLYARDPQAQDKVRQHRAERLACVRNRSEREAQRRRIRAEVAERAAERAARRVHESQELMAALADTDFSAGSRPAPEPGSSGREFLIVSGVPRSGTSLMMQMLAAGGVPVLCDEERPADPDNPEGYYEWQQVKRLPRDPQLIEQAEGKVVKVITLLLAHLPRQHRYRVVFMRRPAAEAAASQKRMLENLGHAGLLPAREKLERLLERHQKATVRRLTRYAGAEVLVVDYPELVADPEQIVGRLQEFVGAERLPHAEAMQQVVRPELYRQRGTS